jgi:hypothetical protein
MVISRRRQLKVFGKIINFTMMIGQLGINCRPILDMVERK